MENSYKSSKNELQSYKIKLIQYAVKLISHQLPLPLVLTCIIIENLQLIAMATISPLNFTSLGLNYFQYFANVIYPEHYFRTTSLLLYLVPFFLLFTILHFIIFIWAYSHQSNIKKIVHYIFFLSNTILVSPNLLANISVLTCTSSSPFSREFTCFQSFHILYVILALVNLGWVFFSFFFIFVFYINRDPFTSGYYGSSSNLWMVGKFLLKLAPVIYINVDPNLDFAVLYVVSFAALNLINFGVFKIMWPFFRNCQKIQKIVIHSQTVVIFVTAFFILLQFLYKDDQDNVVFIMSWIIGNIFGQLVINILAFKKQMLIQIYLQDGSKQEQQLQEQGFIQFFYDILYRADRAQEYQILHLLKLHQEKCTNEECSCRNIVNIYEKNENKNIGKQIFYRFINELIRETIEKVHKNNGLKITQAYVSYFKLNEKIKSVQVLSQILRYSKISLTQQISIRKLFVSLINEDHSVTDLRKFNQFSEYMWLFQRETQKAVQNCKNYWTQLIQQDCQISKIWRMANIVDKDKEKLKDIVDSKLLKISPKNLQTLQKYCQLLMTVYGCSYKKIEKYAQIFELTMRQEKQKIQKEEEVLFRENEQMAVMCSVEYEGIFQFIRVSSNIIDILQVRSIDLIQKSINSIIPEIYHEFHNTKIKQYYNKTDEFIVQRNSNVFPISTEGHVIHCTYKAKIIPSFQYGLEMISFLRKNKSKGDQSKKYLMYFYSEITEETINHENSKSHKSGDILHVDPELRQILLSEDEAELNQNYNSRIEEILPYWDTKEEQYIKNQNDKNFGNSLVKIELAHQDQLFPGTYVKYLAFRFRSEDEARLFIQPFNLFQQFQSSKKQNFGQVLGDSYLQASDSRLNLMENEKSIHQLAPIKVSLSSQPFKLSKKIIALISKIIIGVLIVFNVLNYQIRQKQIGIKKQDFYILNCTYEIKSNLYEIGLQNLFTNVTGNINNEQLLRIVGNDVKDIYKLIGISSINDKITVNMVRFQNGVIKNRVNSSLNDAIGYIITVLLQLLGNMNDYDSFLNYVSNIQAIHDGCDQLPGISEQLMNKKFSKLQVQDILFQFFQFFIILFLDILLALRIYKVYQFAKYTIAIYEQKMEINHIKQYSKRCDYFLEKVRGVYQCTESQKKQHIKVVFMQFKNIFSSHIPKKISRQQSNQQKSLSNGQLNQNQRQEEEKLLVMKRKVTFQEGPPKIKYIISALIFIFAWVSIKVGIRFINDPKKIEMQRNLNRTIINSNLDINSEMYRLMFYLTAHHPYNAPFFTVLSSLEGQLINISSIDRNIRQEVDLHELFQVLIQLGKNPSALLLAEVKDHIQHGHQSIYEHLNKKMVSSYEATYSSRPAYMLAIYIMVNIISIIFLYQLYIIQEEIRVGCSLMVEMIGQTMIQREEKKYRYKQLESKLAI